jgi:hypothetical protein
MVFQGRPDRKTRELGPHKLLRRAVHDRIGRGDDEALMAPRIRIGPEAARLPCVTDIDVTPEIRLPRPGIRLDRCSLPIVLQGEDVREPKGDDDQAGMPAHQLIRDGLADLSLERVGPFRAVRMPFVESHVGRGCREGKTE